MHEVDHWIETNESFAQECETYGHTQMGKTKLLLALVERQLKIRIHKLVLDPAQEMADPATGWHNVIETVKGLFLSLSLALFLSFTSRRPAN